MIIRVSVKRPIDQDAIVVGLIRYDDDGKQYYAKSVEWQQFESFEILDLSAMTFPAADATVELNEFQQRVVR